MRNTIWLCLVVLLVINQCNVITKAQPEVPCFFVFGDSLVDNGNNNFLLTIAKANYVPYGIDFLDSDIPTGRFSNGKSTVDVLAEKLGFKNYIPASMNIPKYDQQILGGLNYASAAAGIRDESGWKLGDRIPMNAQLDKFKETLSQMETMMGDKVSATNHVNKCLFSVGLGSNDYLNNYFAPSIFYPISHTYSPEDYANVLIAQYAEQIVTLHNYGARKVAIIGPGPIGCTPNALAFYSGDGVTCIESFNSAIHIFNQGLKSLVDYLNKNFTDSKFTFIDSYAIFEDMTKNAASLGFTDTTNACCGLGRNSGGITCIVLQIPCPNRNEYLFWDPFHPTEAANVIIASRSFKAQSPADAYPMDISQLVMS